MTFRIDRELIAAAETIEAANVGLAVLADALREPSDLLADPGLVDLDELGEPNSFTGVIPTATATIVLINIIRAPVTQQRCCDGAKIKKRAKPTNRCGSEC